MMRLRPSAISRAWPRTCSGSRRSSRSIAGAHRPPPRLTTRSAPICTGPRCSPGRSSRRDRAIAPASRTRSCASAIARATTSSSSPNRSGPGTKSGCTATASPRRSRPTCRSASSAPCPDARRPRSCGSDTPWNTTWSAPIRSTPPRRPSSFRGCFWQARSTAPAVTRRPRPRDGSPASTPHAVPWARARSPSGASRRTSACSWTTWSPRPPLSPTACSPPGPSIACCSAPTMPRSG